MNGAHVGITAHRRAIEQARLVESLGGVPVLAPTLEADVPRRTRRLEHELVAVIEAPIHVAVFLTGIGVRLVFEAAARCGVEQLLRERLARSEVVARGPKPRRELRGLGVRIDWSADPASTLLIRDRLLAERRSARRILIQAFAEPPDVLTGPLAAAGAECLVVTPYSLDWPEDAGPAQRLARQAAGGSLDAITFTTARAGQQFVAIAESAGVGVDDLRRGGALIAAVGRVTRAALEAEGVVVHVEADPPRMGALYRAVATALAAGATGWAPERRRGLVAGPLPARPA